MDYIANVENSEIDVSGIRTVLVQGDSSYPVIRFVLDPSLTGLSWRVRGTYTATNIAVLSPEILATESATEITIDWSVGSDFTTYDGDMQLSLVGANDAGTTVVKALADITIQKDWSIGTMGSITLNLFEQLMAQADAAISKYPTIIGGNWYVWNVTVGEYQDTGVAASSQWKSGTGITGTSTAPTAFPSSGITMSNVGDMYLNATTGNTYRCTLSGAAAVALWVYVSNITGPQPDITDGSITNAKLANMANNTIKGNVSGSAAAPSDLTVAQVRGIITEGTSEVDAIADGDKFVIEDVSATAGVRTKHVLWSALKTALRSIFMPYDATSTNLLINGGFNINQRAVSGTVTLSAGAYGHDRWKAGASGCTYTFATSENVTTLTISAGSLIQVVEGLNLKSGTVCLSWTGTAQGKIGAGSYSASGVTGTATGGTNLNIEFNTGTLSKVQLNYGSGALPFVPKRINEEYSNAYRYAFAIGPGALFPHTSIDANYIDFVFTVPAPLRVTPTISGIVFLVFNSSGLQTGFTFSALSSPAGTAKIRASKTAHGLTEATLTASTSGVLDSEL